MNRVLVAGLGNEMRGDDAAGLLAARAVRRLAQGGVDVEEFEGDMVSLAEAMAVHPEVIVVDAVQADVAAGTVLELTPEQASECAVASSHGLGVGSALALARVSGGTPSVRVFGIAGRSFTLGAAPSEEVVRGAARAAVEISALL